MNEQLFNSIPESEDFELNDTTLTMGKTILSWIQLELQKYIYIFYFICRGLFSFRYRKEKT